MASLLQTMRSGVGTQHPEQIINFLTSRFVLTSGIWDKANNEFLVEESDTPAMSVDIRQGYAFLVNSSAGMVYPVRLTTEDATVAISSNSSGNSRIDAIVLYQDLGASPNATISNVAKLVAVEGTPAASPSAPDSTAIETEIGASNPYTVLAYVTVDSGETAILDADISDQRTDATYTTKIGSSIGTDGWVDADEAWSYSAWDATSRTAQITVPTDATTKYQSGMRVKFTQPTDGVKYGIVVKVEATTLHVFMHADNDFDNEAITSPNYSTMKAPLGFDARPDKWTLRYSDTDDDSLNSGTTFANTPAYNLTLPAGAWLVGYKVAAYTDMNGADVMPDLAVTLSTTTTTESNPELTTGGGFGAYNSANGDRRRSLGLALPLTPIFNTAQDIWYLLSKTYNNSVGSYAAHYLEGTEVRTDIWAVCAYL